MISITNKTEMTIFSTWDIIASDAYEMCDNDNEIAMEFVLDANRLTMNGYSEADAELKSLYEKYTYASVLAALSKNIQLL